MWNEAKWWHDVKTDLMDRAQGGDGDAFRELTEPYRRELHVHCYRMLGSLQDAEDALQNTWLSAWQGLSGFEQRASIRSWLYRIATNHCLSTLRSAKRRSVSEVDSMGFDLPEPTHRGEIVWLEPFPDDLLDGSTATAVGPEIHFEQKEAISLAFIIALQVLPARQRAVLILREVLGYHADEVADMLDSTVDAVNSALKRARAALGRRHQSGDSARPAPNSPDEQALIAKFVRAFQSGDVDAVVALLTADVRLSMPPIPLEYHGRDVVARFYANIFREGGFDLLPTRANGQPAFGAYRRTGTTGMSHPAGLLVLSVTGGQISALTRFDNDVLPWFGLPASF